ncbi:MAG TPA: ABC transporter ATP-binding protein [Anaerolineales bacterium]|jgi:ATP-binding cassette subfamily B protein|nr:ABC transporter ATP-binding protein [Anaerolineales bacterium]
MLRLRKYLTPYLPIFVLTVALLFVQANAELALPDYMSRIVNNGIQQNGIESPIPEVIRQSTFDKLMIFMDDDDQDLARGSYQLLEPEASNYAKLVQEFPGIETENVYFLGEVTKEDLDRLEPVMARSQMVVFGIQQAIDNPDQAPVFGEGLSFDLSMVPSGMDVFQLLSSLPAAQLDQMLVTIDQQFDALGDSMVSQMAVGAVKQEYEALGVDSSKLQSDYILSTGGTMLLISLLAGVCTIIVGFFASRTAAGVARDLRKAVFEKIESFSSAEFNKFSTASLITRSTNDVTQVQMVIFMVMRMVFYAPIIGIGGIIRAISKGASMWWIIAAAVAALLALILIVFVIALPKFKIIQSLIDKLNLVTRESLSGMMVIRAFNKQEYEEKRFEKANRNLTDNSLFVARVMVTMFPIMMLIMNGLSLAIIWVGSQQVAAASMQVGDMIAFLQYAMQIVFAFLMLSMMFIFIPRAAVSGERIADVLETETEIRDPETPIPFSQPFNATIEFRNVSFKYPDAPDNVLHDITFTARPGETTAFIGSTGCGKSTVVNLIPRFYDATEGNILVNGTDIRQVRQTDLRDKIGYVPQKGMLFSGTIESNLRYADQDADQDTLEEAVEIAQASEFVLDGPDGFSTPISQGGSNVSGGQKQRLAIARALVKKPPIYIFDDSFSSLDYKTDSALRKALKEKTGESTVLIVTQRVATIKNADQIIVLDEGKVVGKGTHHNLMQTCEPYQEIAYSQLSREELE